MLRWRLLSTAVLVPLLALALLWEGWGGALVFTLLCMAGAPLAVGEFLELAARAGHPGLPRFTRRFAVLLLLAVGLVPVLVDGTVRLNAEALEAIVLGAFLVLGFRHVLHDPDRTGAVQRILVSVAGLVYVCWTLGFVPKLYFAAGLEREGRWLAFFLIAVTKAGDIGAYTVGMLTARLPGGNHKIMPAVSPKKSWEGLAGGVAACVGMALLLAWRWPERFAYEGVPVLGAWSAAGWGFFAAVLGFWGDVAESALKRAAGVKNSGVVPGFGGVLDVLDSLILVAPFFYAYVVLCARPA